MNCFFSFFVSALNFFIATLIGGEEDEELDPADIERLLWGEGDDLSVLLGTGEESTLGVGDLFSDILCGCCGEVEEGDLERERDLLTLHSPSSIDIATDMLFLVKDALYLTLTWFY